MTLAELISAARARLDDEDSSKYRWSDTQLKSWANEGNSEACRRTRYLVNSSLSSAILSGTATYNFPGDVIFIHRAKLSDEDCPLIFASYKDFDATVPGWQTHTGTPTHIILDMSIEQYTLYPIPDAAKTIYFIVILEPDFLTYESEMPSRFCYALIDWMMYRAYQMSDIDKQNIQKSMDYLASFEMEFGAKSSAKDEIFNFRTRPYDNYDGNY